MYGIFTKDLLNKSLGIKSLTQHFFKGLAVRVRPRDDEVMEKKSGSLALLGCKMGVLDGPGKPTFQDSKDLQGGRFGSSYKWNDMGPSKNSGTRKHQNGWFMMVPKPY